MVQSNRYTPITNRRDLARCKGLCLCWVKINTYFEIRFWIKWNIGFHKGLNDIYLCIPPPFFFPQKKSIQLLTFARKQESGHAEKLTRNRIVCFFSVAVYEQKKNGIYDEMSRLCYRTTYTDRRIGRVAPVLEFQFSANVKTNATRNSRNRPALEIDDFQMKRIASNKDPQFLWKPTEHLFFSNEILTQW